MAKGIQTRRSRSAAHSEDLRRVLDAAVAYGAAAAVTQGTGGAATEAALLAEALRAARDRYMPTTMAWLQFAAAYEHWARLAERTGAWAREVGA